ncbi:hypothetical protein EDB84DRAFT_1675719 [Lactarius hengduanensis]|nr:hypothetical protein EDB84DRAFT_1675719 [Lactarius hengduanensis]
MEDEIPRPRPRRVNANTHPGKIVNDLKQKRRTTAEKVADDKAKASKEKEETTKAKKTRQAEVAQVAEFEDALRREDRAYPNIVNEGDTDSDTHKLRASNDESEVVCSEAEVPEDIASNTKSQSESNLDDDVHMSGPEDPEGHQVVVRDTDDDDSDDEYQNDPDQEDPDTDKEESEHPDSGLEELEEEIVARKMEKKGKKKRKGSVDKKKKKTHTLYPHEAPTPAKSGLREEITQVRKTSAVSGQKRKPGPEPVKDSSDESEDEEERTKRPQKKIKKRKGDTAPASGLRTDWRKLIDHSGSRSKYYKMTASLKDPTTQPRTPTILDANDDHVTVASELSQSRPSSRTSALQSTSDGLDGGVQDLWPSGTFDNDEDSRSLQAARAAKKAKVPASSRSESKLAVQHQAGSRPSASYTNNRTTSVVGPVVKKKDINTAGLTRGPIVKTEGNELSKPYRLLKVSDIPVAGEHELAQWDRIVRGVLDWAGTLPDTFGTNEHPDLLDTVQGLWDKCLPERTEDVRVNPAIKKVVIDRLNEWRSAIGKKAVAVINDFIKHDATLRRDSAEVASFVRGLLPYPNEQPVAFPLIYSNPKASKGSWLAPLLLQVFAVHLRRVTKAPTNFGFPAGALALSTAARVVKEKGGEEVQPEKGGRIARIVLRVPAFGPDFRGNHTREGDRGDGRCYCIDWMIPPSTKKGDTNKGRVAEAIEIRKRAVSDSARRPPYSVYNTNHIMQLERGLTLFKTGVNVRDEKAANNAGRAFDNNPWGTIACQYAQSTCDLSERKWGQVIGAASIYLADRVGAPNVETQRIPVIPDGHSRIAVSDDEADDEADI